MDSHNNNMQTKRLSPHDHHKNNHIQKTNTRKSPYKI